MGNERVQDTGEERHWRKAFELPSYVFEVLRKPNRRISPVAIVATVDTDGKPRTAPFGSLRAVTPRLLRLACDRRHDTYANFCRDGRVSVAVLAAPDIAVSVRGRARVVKERMEIAEHLVVVEVEVEDVKNDMMRRGVIEGEVGFAPPEELKVYYVGAIAEIEDM
ncbi:MAG: pyridoxamine 5'-phosphate oxidase family protein [Chloroflexi bacterium]|nr:pyridoxamine 5'-phosphate oxidase family protein [Chloroflexota bacterium]